MRLGSFAAAAISILSAQLAWAAPQKILLPPAPDLAGEGSGKQLVRAVSQACAAAHVRVASTAELKRTAVTAQVILNGRLSIEQAAKLVSRGGFAGVVMFRKASSGAFAQLVDPHGQVTLERLLRVKKGTALDVDAAAFAAAVAQSLAPSPPQVEAATPQESAVPTPPVRVEPPPPPLPPSAESADTAAALAGPELVAPRSTEPAAGYYFRLGFSGGAAERRFLAPGFSYVTGYPYATGGVSLELFPFRAVGLGLVGDFSFGRVADELVGGNGTFNSNDVRVDAALAWRVKLFAGHYGTYLIPRIGYGFRDFIAPASSGFPRAERSFLVAGLAVTQPIVPRYLRVSGGIAALPFSRLEGSAQSVYGTSSSFGLEWMAELGGDIVGGLEWALQAEQERFMDSYRGPPATSGSDIYTGYTLQLRYRF
jgi:hypothetical protein